MKLYILLCSCCYFLSSFYFESQLLLQNIDVLFTMQEIKDKVEEFRQPAAARANAVAQCDVDIAAGPTSLDPSQTSFFQALGISTKIQKGTLPGQALSKEINWVDVCGKVCSGAILEFLI